VTAQRIARGTPATEKLPKIDSKVLQPKYRRIKRITHDKKRGDRTSSVSEDIQVIPKRNHVQRCAILRGEKLATRLSTLSGFRGDTILDGRPRNG